MFKQMALALACLACTAVAASAQQTADAPVTLAIQTPLTLTETGATDFGTLNSTSGSGTVDPVAPAAGTTTAMFTLAGPPGASILVTWPTSVSLTLADNSASVSFTPKLSTSGTNVQSGSIVKIGSSLSGQLNPSGTIYMWLGGTASFPTTQKPGNYSGTFTLTVTSN